MLSQKSIFQDNNGVCKNDKKGVGRSQSSIQKSIGEDEATSRYRKNKS